MVGFLSFVEFDNVKDDSEFQQLGMFCMWVYVLYMDMFFVYEYVLYVEMCFVCGYMFSFWIYGDVLYVDIGYVLYVGMFYIWICFVQYSVVVVIGEWDVGDCEVVLVLSFGSGVILFRNYNFWYVGLFWVGCVVLVC